MNFWNRLARSLVQPKKTRRRRQPTKRSKSLDFNPFLKKQSTRKKTRTKPATKPVELDGMAAPGLIGWQPGQIRSTGKIEPTEQQLWEGLVAGGASAEPEMRAWYNIAFLDRTADYHTRTRYRQALKDYYRGIGIDFDGIHNWQAWREFMGY